MALTYVVLPQTVSKKLDVFLYYKIKNFPSLELKGYNMF